MVSATNASLPALCFGMALLSFSCDLECIKGDFGHDVSRQQKRSTVDRSIHRMAHTMDKVDRVVAASSLPQMPMRVPLSPIEEAIARYHYPFPVSIPRH